jgi:hypothetical protein
MMNTFNVYGRAKIIFCIGIIILYEKLVTLLIIDIIINTTINIEKPHVLNFKTCTLKQKDVVPMVSLENTIYPKMYYPTICQVTYKSKKCLSTIKF